MKKILFFCAFMFALTLNAQYIEKSKEYTASNGVTYKIGDTITLGQGSGINGHFAYFQMGGFYNAMAATNGRYNQIGAGIGRNFSGMNVILKKIKTQKDKRGSQKVFFVVGGGNITNYNLMIEEAIETCEIKICKNVKDVRVVSQDSKYDELKKIKELKDSGVLTEEEYQKEKEKIMNK